MGRKNREWVPGGTYHVMSRGNRREVLFKEDADYLMFLEYVQRVKEKHRFTIHACCLMTNHFHKIIETESLHSFNDWKKKETAAYPPGTSGSQQSGIFPIMHPAIISKLH